MKTSFPLFTLLLFFSFLSVMNAQTNEFMQQQVAVNDEIFDIYQLPPKNNSISSSNLLAVGDNCNDPISVTVNGNNVQHSLAGAANSGIMPPCANSSTIFDTWFVTQADENGYLHVSFNTPNNEPKEFGLTFWRDCSGTSEALIICDNSPIQFTGRLFFPPQLSPNQTVYVQVWSYQESMQEITVDARSYCNIFYGSEKLISNNCDVNNSTFSPVLSVEYYTIFQEANIEVRDSNFQTIYSTPATGSPQTITLSDLTANGKSQKYFIGLDVCNSFTNLNLQAPNSDCSIAGGNCSDAISLPLSDFEESCTNLSDAGFSGLIPSCSEESRGAIQDVWFQAQSDEIGSLRFEMHEKDYGLLTVGYSIYDDCLQPQISFCHTPPPFETSFNVFEIPAEYRVPNKIWYLQVWAYAGQEQNICVKASPDCNIFKAELGATECINDDSFNQEIILEHFNLPSGSTIRILNASQGYSLILETAVTASPQTILVPNLDAKASEIDLSINSSSHSCYGRFLNNIPIPDCANGSNCPADMVVTGFVGLGNYHATNTITTDLDTRVFSKTTFKAGASITLKAGFQVFHNAEFSAIIEDCPNTSSTLVETEVAAIQPIFPENQVLVAQDQLKVYPNPFNNTTTIEYQLDQSGQVEIALFDITGKQLKQIEQGYKGKGTYQMRLNADNLEAGLYFIYANLKGIVTTKKVYLVN